MAIRHPRGTILLVEQVLDPNGTNPKTRPILLVADFYEGDDLIDGVAVSSTFDEPLPVTQVELPFSRSRTCRTGLDRPSVAVCDWPVTATPDDIVKRIGAVPAKELLDILQRVAGNMPPEETG